MRDALFIAGQAILAREPAINVCPDCHDAAYFRRHPDRHYIVRPSLPGEVERLCKESGRPNPVEPGTTGFVIGRRVRDTMIRHAFPVEPPDRAELEAAADDEEICRSMFNDLLFLRQWAATAHLYDWDKETRTTIQ